MKITSKFQGFTYEAMEGSEAVKAVLEGFISQYSVFFTDYNKSIRLIL